MQHGHKMSAPKVMLRGAARNSKLARMVAKMIDDNLEAMLNCNGVVRARIDRYNHREIELIKTHTDAYIAVLEQGGMIEHHRVIELLDANHRMANVAVASWKNLQDEFYKYENLGDGKGDFEAWANARSNEPEPEIEMPPCTWTANYLKSLEASNVSAK
jgi:uncharacterized protein (UPF0248 family)